MPIRYRIILFILSPVVLAYLAYSAWRRGGLGFIQQRLGYAYHKIHQQSIWIHAASLGEANSVLPLVNNLLKQNPKLKFLITTNTATGAKTVKTKFPSQVQHCYLPFDFHYAVRRFLNHASPKCALIVETELWPNLYANCQQLNIPITLINARLSGRTLEASNYLKPVFYYCLQQVDRILARGETDQASFIQLGANPNKIEVIGNLKYAQPVNTSIQPININRPYILAASTHEGEETLLLKIWRGLPKQNHLLVIAPRYPERRDNIINAIRAEKLNYAVRSHGDKIEENTDVYLVDTLGELNMFLGGAEIVFMGGSMVPRGGQNVLEPAHFGRAIITGPQTFTFKEEISALLEAGAIIQVDDESELAHQLETLLTHPKQAQRLGHNAKAFMQEQVNVIEEYSKKIEEIISRP